MFHAGGKQRESENNSSKLSCFSVSRRCLGLRDQDISRRDRERDRDISVRDRDETRDTQTLSRDRDTQH